MEARLRLTSKLLVCLGLALSLSSHGLAASYRTQNFVVQAPTTALAQEIGNEAERLREQLAIEWIGEPMPAWSSPCPIKAQVSPRLGAGGATTFVFDRGEVFDWQMSIQGSRERVLDSVLPHEITHTVFASYFRRPLPRWADEGACTTVEHLSEIGKQERLLIQFLKTGKGIPFAQMFAMKEYPRDVLPLYAQGHSLTQYLIERRGRTAFLNFLADGMRDENWRRAVSQHYGSENLYALQEEWLGWVRDGRPRVALDPDLVVASAEVPTNSSTAVQNAAAITPIAPVASATPASGPRQASRPSVYTLQESGQVNQPAIRDASTVQTPVWR